jgi:pilus assembly protein CpaC
MIHGRTLWLFCTTLLVVSSPVATTSAQPAAERDDMGPSVAEYEAIMKVTKKQDKLRMVEKFAKILETDARILQVDGFDADVLDVTPLSPNQLRVQAVRPGVSSMLIVDENKKIYNLDVFVMGDVRHLQAYISQMFPHATVEAVAIEGSVVLRGFVAQPEHITEISDIAEQFYPKVLNQMKVGGVQQVMMRVKVMEVQRTKMRKFGFNFTKLTAGGDSFSSSPGAILDPSVMFTVIGAGGAAFTGFLDALKEEGMLDIKAEPILITTNGRPASLLNGGEFPILVPQALGTVSVEWRQFGVNLQAVPIVLGNGRLRLELQPEVSEIDEANAVQIGDIRVPALTTRRVNTQVEMKFGQSLMIAGLITKQERAATAKIPLFGEIPYLGALFGYKEFEESESELVVMVTPEYVSPLDASEVSPVEVGDVSVPPTDRELFLDNMIEIPNYGGPLPYNLHGIPIEGGGHGPHGGFHREPCPVPSDNQLILPPEPSTNQVPLAPPESAWWNQSGSPASPGGRRTHGQEADWMQVEYSQSNSATRTGQGWSPRATEGLVKP